MGSRVAIIFPSFGREAYELAFIHCFPTVSFDPGSCFDDRLVNLEGVDGVPLVKHGSSSSNFGMKIPNKKMHEFSSPIFFCSCKWKLDSSQQKLRGKTLIFLYYIPSTKKTTASHKALEKIDGLIGKLSLFLFAAVAAIFREGQVASLKAHRTKE